MFEKLYMYEAGRLPTNAGLQVTVLYIYCTSLSHYFGCKYTGQLPRMHLLTSIKQAKTYKQLPFRRSWCVFTSTVYTTCGLVAV